MPKNNGCDCRKCKNCCWISPGWFGSIKEVRGAAKIVGMPVREFAKEFLIGEWWAGDDEDVIVPAPRKNFDRLSDVLSKEQQELDKIKTRIGKASLWRKGKSKILHNDIWKEAKLRNGKGFVRASWGHNLMAGFACIFLTEDEKCIIHKSKPTECRKSFGCKKTTVKPTTRIRIAKYWKKHQDFIEYLNRQ